MTEKKLSKYIDHTLLAADATESQIKRVCDEAREYDFMSVCVNSCWTAFVHQQLKGSDVKTCTVVGFPLGAMSSKAKLAETECALADGADEIDMVINIADLKDKKYDRLRDEIALLKAAVGPDRVLKVIIETCLLTDEEKVKVCQLAVEAGADYVKTSTGFSKWGARVEDVKLMKEAVGDKALVKASGGVHSREEALALIEAGASRIGASHGIEIIAEDK